MWKGSIQKPYKTSNKETPTPPPPKKNKEHKNKNQGTKRPQNKELRKPKIMDYETKKGSKNPQN
jgi:hypothetical protein